MPIKLKRATLLAGVAVFGAVAATASVAQAAERLNPGFAQVGSEPGWRAAETKTAKLRANSLNC